MPPRARRALQLRMVFTRPSGVHRSSSVAATAWATLGAILRINWIRATPSLRSSPKFRTAAIFFGAATLAAAALADAAASACADAAAALPASALTATAIFIDNLAPDEATVPKDFASDFAVAIAAIAEATPATLSSASLAEATLAMLKTPPPVGDVGDAGSLISSAFGVGMGGAPSIWIRIQRSSNSGKGNLRSPVKVSSPCNRNDGSCRESYATTPATSWSIRTRSSPLVC
mmetsp:Transcript_36263/g.117248  ORF Transcript_36263/g.117248 Transcript_36263/m.117248 type:complete len:232 (-) Transcript_36263:2227-2922(-)